MANARVVERVVGLWIIMLPRTAVHWQSSTGDGDKFGAEQLTWFKVVHMEEL